MLASFQEWLTAAEADTGLQHTAFSAPPASSSQLPVPVVGAGPGGLCAMAELNRRSIPFVCLELHSGVGGIWDVASTHSPMYEGLTCNGSRYSMTLDKPWDMPNDDPLFPTDRHIPAYLNHFADKHDIRQHCRFGCRVEQATFDEAVQCWSVRYKEVASGEERTEQFSDLIAASGLNGRSSAYIPSELAAQCEAAHLPFCHSSSIKQPSSYANKRVLVVGLGISGADVAAQLARYTRDVVLAVRTPQHILQVSVYGQLLDRLIGGDLPNIAVLPQWMARALLWAGGGLLERVVAAVTKPWVEFGLKRPQHSLLEKVPVSDDGSFRAAVRDGKVKLRNQVRAFSPGKVHYDNTAHTAAVDSTVESDDIASVIFCTGYRFLHPYLPPGLSPTTRRPVHIPTGRYPDLGQLTPYTLTTNLTFLVLSPRNSHLYFMTEVQAGFAWLVFQDQAKTIVAAITARREQSERIRRFDRVVVFPNIAFTGPLLGGLHGFIPMTRWRQNHRCIRHSCDSSYRGCKVRNEMGIGNYAVDVCNNTETGIIDRYLLT